jgi:hypothetical protein
LSEDLFGHPIFFHSLQVTQSTYPLPLYPFHYQPIILLFIYYIYIFIYSFIHSFAL